ncbi:hypothetical protein N7540_013034 [Penicillium herquei]|nr:hypothetical protein N7540_013034 [Penicillium herquei]
MSKTDEVYKLEALVIRQREELRSLCACQDSMLEKPFENAYAALANLPQVVHHPESTHARTCSLIN